MHSDFTEYSREDQMGYCNNVCMYLLIILPCEDGNKIYMQDIY